MAEWRGPLARDPNPARCAKAAKAYCTSALVLCTAPRLIYFRILAPVVARGVSIGAGRRWMPTSGRRWMPTSVASPHPSNLIEPELPKSEQVAGVAGRGGPSVEASHRTGAQHAPTAPIRGDGRGRHTAGARITRRGHGAGGQGAAGRIPPRAADRVRARPRGWRLAPPHPCLNAGFYRACT